MLIDSCVLLCLELLVRGIAENYKLLPLHLIVHQNFSVRSYKQSITDIFFPDD